jgi:FtsP/CotA-like multicopper oxidase with cupredoxin domain
MPRRYGVDDIPMVLQDRKFHDDGSLDMSGLAFGGLSVTGLLGDRILVNGGYDPYLEISTELVRFRLLNGANARVFSVGFTDDREFSLVATEAGLRDAPLPLRRLMLSPGERAEIVVRFQPGEDVVLRSSPPPMGGNALIRRLAGGADTFDLVKIVAAATLRPSPALPARLAAGPPVPRPTRPEPYRMTMGDFRSRTGPWTRPGSTGWSGPARWSGGSSATPGGFRTTSTCTARRSTWSTSTARHRRRT